MRVSSLKIRLAACCSAADLVGRCSGSLDAEIGSGNIVRISSCRVSRGRNVPLMVGRSDSPGVLCAAPAGNLCFWVMGWRSRHLVSKPLRVPLVPMEIGNKDRDISVCSLCRLTLREASPESVEGSGSLE